MIAELLANVADPQAPAYIDAVRALRPAEAEAALALWHARSGRSETAVTQLVQAFETYREVPWAGRPAMRRALMLAQKIAAAHPELAPALVAALAAPFAVRVLDEERLQTRAAIGLSPGLEGRCAAAFADLEPDVPWERDFLERRLRCYSSDHHPLEARARSELEAFVAQAPGAGLNR